MGRYHECQGRSPLLERPVRKSFLSPPNKNAGSSPAFFLAPYLFTASSEPLASASFQNRPSARSPLPEPPHSRSEALHLSPSPLSPAGKSGYRCYKPVRPGYNHFATWRYGSRCPLTHPEDGENSD